MPSKKKKYNARFPPARIKKIMQTDEDVGKVAAAVPVIISRSLEMFIESLILKSNDITQSRNAKTLSTAHIKHIIEAEKKFDFLRDLVANVPDIQQTEEDTDAQPGPADQSLQTSQTRTPRPSSSSAEKPAASSSAPPPLGPDGKPVKRPRGRPRKVRPEDQAPQPPKKRGRKKKIKEEEEELKETGSDGSSTDDAMSNGKSDSGDELPYESVSAIKTEQQLDGTKDSSNSDVPFAQYQDPSPQQTSPLALTVPKRPPVEDVQIPPATVIRPPNFEPDTKGALHRVESDSKDTLHKPSGHPRPESDYRDALHQSYGHPELESDPKDALHLAPWQPNLESESKGALHRAYGHPESDSKYALKHDPDQHSVHPDSASHDKSDIPSNMPPVMAHHNLPPQMPSTGLPYPVGPHHHMGLPPINPCPLPSVSSAYGRPYPSPVPAHCMGSPLPPPYNMPYYGSYQPPAGAPPPSHYPPHHLNSHNKPTYKQDTDS